MKEGRLALTSLYLTLLNAMPQSEVKVRDSSISLCLFLYHQTGHDIQQAEEDPSRPAVPADPGLR